MRTLRPLLLALALVCSGALAACGGSDSTGDGGAGTPTPTAADGSPTTITRNPANAKITLTIGSKNFTEQRVLGEIYAQGLAAAGYTVRTQLNLGDQDIAHK